MEVQDQAVLKTKFKS